MPNLPSDSDRKQGKSTPFGPPVSTSHTSPTSPTDPSVPDKIHDNDHGNAQRLINTYGDSIRYCHAVKCWLIWDGQRWCIDRSNQVRHMAEAVIKDFWRDVSSDSERRGFASMSMNRSRISDMLASTEHHLAVSPDQLDSDPDFLNFTNGIVDLRTSLLAPHFPSHYITKLIHYDYNPAAQCPTFLSFLARITEPCPDIIPYLQTALGYSLTGHTREKVVFLPWGTGDNGKTTLLGTVRQLIREYACLIQIDTLMSKQETNNTQSDLSDLRGSRFVMTSETDKGQRLAEGKLKRITQGSGGVIKSAKKYENHIEFPETHKLWIDANNLPIVRGTDNAIWNRLHPVPFPVSIPKAEQDSTLRDKLLAEAEGILAWLVEGARLWHANGLTRPTQIAEALTQWRAQSDQLTSFLTECCVVGFGGDMTGSAIYEMYERWAHGEAEENLHSKKDFLEEILKYGVTRKRRKEGYVFLGVKPRRRGGRVGFAPEDLSDGDGEDE